MREAKEKAEMSLHDSIHAFSLLESNWDSYGAAPFNAETIALAHYVADKLDGDWKVMPCSSSKIMFYRNEEDEIIEVYAEQKVTP